MPLHGLRWFAGAAVVASGIIAACGYPNFTYDNGQGGSKAASSSTGSPQGGGGSGGTMTASTTSSSISATTSVSSTTSAAGGGGAMPMGQVSCADGADLCSPGEVCCFNEGLSPDCDKCSSDTLCEDSRSECQQAPYDVYECDNDADCGGTRHCCAQIISGNIVQQVRCFTHACSDQTQTRQMCHTNGDCPNQYPSCTDFGYPPFEVCE